MKYEPLKEKIRFLRIEGTNENIVLGSPFVYLHDVKSAVQGLLKDIEKLESEITDEYKNEWLNTPMKHYCISLLNECRGLVKKWLPDVAEGEK